jgi:hypothetical protein
MAFNPNEKLTSLKGKAYLEVKWRLVWFRMEHPDWGITTELVEHNLESRFAIFKATIRNSDGFIVAQGTKCEDIKGFADYIEKAETGAIGRALGVLGYGTQFAPEFDEVVQGAPNPRIVDSPVDIPVKAPAPKPAPDAKSLGLEFARLVNHFEGNIDNARIRDVFALLTNNADRNIETFSAAIECIADLSASEYTNLINSLEANNG